MVNKHCNDVSSGAVLKFECEECGRKFTTKPGCNRHKTVAHKNVIKEEMLKRARSVQDKTNACNFKCELCSYTCRSTWALKAHINHKHNEPTSPNEKKPKVSEESKLMRMISSEILNEVVSKVVCTDYKEEEISNKKTPIEPTKEFLTNTAVTLAEMLDNIAGEIHIEDENEEEETEELEDRLDILRGDAPRNKKYTFDEDVENTLVTLPLRDVEELRLKVRNLEDINEGFLKNLENVEAIEAKLRNLEEANQELTQKLKYLTENKNKKFDKKNNEQKTVIEMETNEEEFNLEQILINKDKGYARSNPQEEPQKKPEIHVYDCSGCEKKFNKREHMIVHQKTHEVSCQLCDKLFKTQSKLQEHERKKHDEMICHVQCGRGICVINEVQNEVNNSYKCKFCDEKFSSNNALSKHKQDVHKTYKPCRDIANCVFQAGCYFSHVPVTLGKFRCFQCGEEFSTKNTMMIHRKIHGGVHECRSSITNQCNRGQSCWWSHKTKDQVQQQVFQKVQENLPPPILNSQQQTAPHSHTEVQMTSNQMIVSMLLKMDLQLKKMKEAMNMN